MLWRSLLLTGLMLIVISMSIGTIRPTDQPLTNSLLVLKDNELDQVYFTGRSETLFQPSEGKIKDIRLSQVQTNKLFVTTQNNNYSEFYAIDYGIEPKLSFLFVDSASPPVYYLSPDENYVAYVRHAETETVLIIRTIDGARFKEYKLPPGDYYGEWLDNQTLRYSVARETFYFIDIQTDVITTEPFEFPPQDPYISPDKKWTIRYVMIDLTHSLWGWHLRDAVTHSEKLFFTSMYSRAMIGWSRDSQSILFFNKGQTSWRIHIYDLSEAKLKTVASNIHSLSDANYMVGGYADVAPPLGNWSYDNQWILYSTLTGPITNSDNTISFNVIHRKGDLQFRHLSSHSVVINSVYWVQWLHPQPAQLVHTQKLTLIGVIILFLGFFTGLIRRKIHTRQIAVV